MTTLSRNRLVGAGLALILATNAVVLGGVAYNRGGEPESRLKLTERELVPLRGARPGSESSGIAFNLQWRVLPRNPASHGYWDGPSGSPAWLDEAKLAALGFDLAPPRDTPAGRRHYERLLPRAVLVVLELDGPPYREALERAQRRAEKAAETPTASRNAREDLERERNRASRLFAIDAGTDASALRERYPDRTRYAIVHGKVTADRSGYQSGPMHGWLSGIDNTGINVPVEFHSAIGAAVAQDRYAASATTGIEAEITFGRRLEPWVVTATPRQVTLAEK